MEVHSDVKSNSHVISCGDICNGALVPNGIFGNHDADFLVVAIQDTAPWIHDSAVLSKELLHSVDSVGNIDLAIAALLVLDDRHDWNSIRVRL